jgi:arylsulfatase A-like enzyme
MCAALLGAATSTAFVALYEARGVWKALAGSGDDAAPFGAVLVAEMGVLAPLPLLLLAAAAGLLVLERLEGAPLLAELRRRRTVPELRLRAAAAAPLVIVAFFVWAIGSAHVARAVLGAPPATAARAIGLGIATGSVGVAIAVGAAGFAVYPTLHRLLVRVDRLAAGFADPYATAAMAIIAVAGLAIIGVGTGDSGGGGGAPGVGMLGVLTRPELDLRPVAELLLATLGAYAASLVVLARPALTSRAATAVAAAACVASLGASSVLCVRAAGALDAAPALADAISGEAPAAGKLLALLRRATDRDHDGYSARFGGGDCDDHDARIGPSATDVPGNGVDEDCSGADTPAAAPAPPVIAKHPSRAAARAKRTYDVILITVDTLRADLGFAGYPKPVTPNLDALAAKSAVFERAYALASYTAKSVGPDLIGKYPSETLRDWEHFTTYYPANTFIAERIKAAGHHTIGGMCHYYFRWKTGYSQGFEVWDTSAIAPGMADNDTSVTSDRMTKLAVELLGKEVPGTTTETLESGEPRRFFAWFHYFDPHLQYVKHPGAPDFRSMPGGPSLRAGYDEEVWFTDEYIGKLLDFVAAQPWGQDTAIILTADHGEGFGEHGIVGHGREIWEPLVRVPLVVYVPGAAPRRIAVKRSNIDLAPTILDLMGVSAPPDELRGASLLDDVFAAPDAELDERDVYIDMPEGPYNSMRRAIITGPSPGMKLIHFGGRHYALYDLSADPDEKTDLARHDDELQPVLAKMNELRSRLHEIRVTGEKKR